MTNQFAPHKPEEIVVCEITKREALLIQYLREISFGQFTVHKANNLIIRLEPKKSIMIDGKEDVTIAVK